MASPSLLTSTLLLLGTLTFFAPICFADYNILYPGGYLLGGQYLFYYGKYRLIMQTDCNLVLYDTINPNYDIAVWATKTKNLGSNCILRMQSDGNLVIYDGGNRAIWASNTGGRQQDYYILVLQSDRNVVIYGGAIWATATNAVGTASVVIPGNSTQPAVVNEDGIAMVTEK